MADNGLVAEFLRFRQACKLQGVLEVHVLCKPDLLVKQSCTALVTELLTLILEATNHASRTRGDTLTKTSAVLIAGISQRLIKADVLGSTHRQLLDRSLALINHQVFLVVLQTLDHTCIIACNGVERVLLVSTDLVNVLLAGLTECRVQTEVSCTALHHLLNLRFALSREIGLLAVLFEAVLDTSIAILDILAELFLVVEARVEETDIQPDVIGILNLLAEKLLLAVP
mmetsp:Transcript_24842/g.69256  ORF Transcript_24842/g.69256 Transcript_24842/m.69256 type:complete len:228 (-) Transcript_24842:828-1511(-)